MTRSIEQIQAEINESRMASISTAIVGFASVFMTAGTTTVPVSLAGSALLGHQSRKRDRLKAELAEAKAQQNK